MSQVTVPRYRENPLIIPFSMLCPGISQNTKHHHLTVYKGQVWGEKSFLDLCDNNVLYIVYDTIQHRGYDMVKLSNDELYIPPSPGQGFYEGSTSIPHNGEIFQSFLALCQISLYKFEHWEDGGPGKGHFLEKDPDLQQLLVGPFQCNDFVMNKRIKSDFGHSINCLPPHSHTTFYLFTKEDFKIYEMV